MLLTWFHGLQLGLLTLAVAMIARAGWLLLVRTAIDTQLLLTAWADAMGSGSTQRARAIVALAPRSSVSRLLHAYIDVRNDDALLVRSELREEASRGVMTIRGLGRMASPVAFVGVMVQLSLAFGGRHDLEGLRRGAVETAAISQAAVSVALGMATASICMAAASRLGSAARLRFTELNATAEVAEGCLGMRIET